MPGDPEHGFYDWPENKQGPAYGTSDFVRGAGDALELLGAAVETRAENGVSEEPAVYIGEERYDSLSEAAEEFGVSASAIRSTLSGEEEDLITGGGRHPDNVYELEAGYVEEREGGTGDRLV